VIFVARKGKKAKNTEGPPLKYSNVKLILIFNNVVSKVKRDFAFAAQNVYVI
jgi:hypothetical protein